MAVTLRNFSCFAPSRGVNDNMNCLHLFFCGVYGVENEKPCNHYYLITRKVGGKGGGGGGYNKGGENDQITNNEKKK